MGKTGSNKRNPYAGARLILLQDSVLCMLASLLSILLVRSLSEPIPGFSVLVWRFLAAALAGSLIGSAVSGLWKMEVRSLNAHLFGVFLLLILLKELVLAVVMIAGFVQLPSKIYAFLAISVDILFTAGLLLAPRYIFATLRREERAVARNLGRMTALVAGTGKTSVALAESAEVSGRYNVVGFLTTDRNEEGHLLDGRVVYFCEDVRDISVLQWRLGGVDTLLFPTDWEHNEARGSAGQPAASAPDHGPMTLLVLPADRALRPRHLHRGRKAGHLPPGADREERQALQYPEVPLDADGCRAGRSRPLRRRLGRPPDEGRPFPPPAPSGRTPAALERAAGRHVLHRLPSGTAVDELPQLWNVLRGDMSFIGYRPERQYYIDQIMERNPRYRYLFQIRPGVTSYATLYNGYTDTLEKMLTRLDLDLYYLRNHSVLFDAKVLGLTFLRIIGGKKF